MRGYRNRSRKEFRINTSKKRNDKKEELARRAGVALKWKEGVVRDMEGRENG